MHGTFMEDAATITHTPTISASFTESISVCTTAGTEVTSAAHATVLPASLAIVAWTTGESAITDHTVVVVTSAAIVAIEEIIAMVAVEASTGHKVVAETSVVHEVGAVPLADPTEVVLSAEAAHVAEVHLAAAASTEVDLVAVVRSVEAHAAVVRSVEDLMAVVMDMAADWADVAKPFTIHYSLFTIHYSLFIKLQLTHLSIHHTLYLIHGLAVIHSLNGFVDDAMANSKHLLSWERISDIVKKCPCSGKEVFQ